MKKILLAIIILFVFSMFFIKKPSGDIQVRIHNSTNKDIFRLWLGQAEHGSRYFFRGNRTTDYKGIKKGELSKYKKVFNTRTGLARLHFNVLSTNKSGQEVGILYRVMGSILYDKLATPNAKGKDKVLAPGKYTLKIINLSKDAKNRKIANYVLIKDKD